MQTTPKLIARFRLDKDGEIRSVQLQRYKHFKIRLTVQDPPDGTQTVTYLLHPSFKKDRVLTIPLGTPDFREDIISYGDFFITVTMEGERPTTGEWFAEAFAMRLSQALWSGYSGAERTPELSAAIDRLAEL